MKKSVTRMKNLETFGIQLDHSGNLRRETCLLVSVTSVNSAGSSTADSIFCSVSNTKSDVTDAEINSVLKNGKNGQKTALACKLTTPPT